jgi:predicted metalloenzyme YecM
LQKKHDLFNIAQVDHLSYKCSSKESFENMRAMFEENSEFIFQSIISLRRIAYIKLKEPIATDLGNILYIELQDQKPDNSQKEKYDHVEVFPVNISYDEMVKKIGELDIIVEVKRPHHLTHNIDIGDEFFLVVLMGPCWIKSRVLR